VTPSIEAMNALGVALGNAVAQCPDAALGLLCATIEDLRMGNPLPVLTQIGEDADWWAASSSAVEMEGYLIAIGRHLPDTPMHQRSRKRMIAALFKAMSAEDRAAFLAWGADQ